MIAVDEETQDLLARHQQQQPGLNRVQFSDGLPAAYGGGAGQTAKQGGRQGQPQPAAPFNADIGVVVNEQPVQIHPLHQQILM